MRLVASVRLAALLLALEALDELAGVATVGLPDVQRAFGLSTAAATLVVFTAPAMIALLAEPWLLLAVARRPAWRRPWLVGGVAAMATGLLLAGLAPSAWVLGAALALAFLGSGVGVNLAQVVLVDSEPDRRALWMSRWGLVGEIGDLGTPLLLAGLGLLTLGWRTGFGLVGGAMALVAVAVALHPFPAPETDLDAEPPTLRGLLAGALGNPRLVGWLVVAMSCALLDDLFTGLAALHIDATFGVSLSVRGLVLVAGNVGAIAGLALAERLVARGVAARRVLAGASLVSMVSLFLWILAPDPWLSAVALLALGAGVSPLWPLVKARAFDAHDGDAATVEALSSALGVVEWTLPVVLGLLADAVGLSWVLALLVLQPLAVMVGLAVDRR